MQRHTQYNQASLVFVCVRVCIYNSVLVCASTNIHHDEYPPIYSNNSTLIAERILAYQCRWPWKKVETITYYTQLLISRRDRCRITDKILSLKQSSGRKT